MEFYPPTGDGLPHHDGSFDDSRLPQMHQKWLQFFILTWATCILLSKPQCSTLACCVLQVTMSESWANIKEGTEWTLKNIWNMYAMRTKYPLLVLLTFEVQVAHFALCTSNYKTPHILSICLHLTTPACLRRHQCPRKVIPSEMNDPPPPHMVLCSENQNNIRVFLYVANR